VKLHVFGLGDGAQSILFQMLSHGLIASAYALIAGTLIWQMRCNKSLLRLKMVRSITVLASLAAIAHLARLVSVHAHHPWIDGLVYLTSAAFGLCGALLLWYWLPQMLAMAQERRLTPVNMVKREDYQALQKKIDNTHAGLQRFATAASHDLRAPLRHISVFAGLIEREEKDTLSQTGRDYLERLNASVDRMQELTTALVEYVRAISADHIPVRLDVMDLVRTTRAEMKVEIESQGAQIEVAPMPAIWADEALMTLVFSHLIDNALKFSKDVPVVRIYARGVHAGWVEIVVEDEGPGIDPRQNEMIFDVLFRMSSGPAEGVGLGLALCRQVVEATGGRIWLDTEYEDGARFVLTLPAAP
jgi:signal transduction histidine kinase